MKIIKEGNIQDIDILDNDHLYDGGNDEVLAGSEKKLKEATRVEYYDMPEVGGFYEDKTLLKQWTEVVSEAQKAADLFYKLGGDNSPAVVYYNIQSKLASSLNKMTADYATGEKDFTDSIDDLIQQLDDTLKITDKCTKELISKLGGLNKVLNKLPKKE